MQFLHEVAHKKREHLRCSTCTRPRTACATCPIDQQPKITGRVEFLLALWNRMKAYGALPAAGGLLDQEESLMRQLDLVGAEWAKWERVREKAEARKGGRRS